MASLYPAITNRTACEDGYFIGYCAKAANGSGVSMCPIGNNAVFCAGRDSNNDDYGYGDCSDSPSANITGNLMGCLQDIVTNNQIGGIGFPILVGKWNFVNESKTGSEIAGIFVFNNDGNMKMTVPSKTGFGDYVLESSWGTPYFDHSHHILTFGYAGGYENNTLTEITSNHIEFIDNHHDIIHLVRYHALPPFTPQLVPPQRNVALLYQQGQTQADLHNYTGALSLYQKALAIDPHNTDILADMGRVLYNLKNYTGAIQSLNKALAINPNHVYALEQKGFILYELGHYREALVSLNKALELTTLSTDANVYGILNDKGLALMKLGDYEQALSTFNAAIEAQQYIDSAYYYKALTFVTLDFHTHNFGDMDAALHLLDKAISINSDNKDASILKGSCDRVLEDPVKYEVVDLGYSITIMIPISLALGFLGIFGYLMFKSKHRG